MLSISKQRQLPTLYGALALFLWALATPMLCFLQRPPLFQVITIAAGAGFLSTLLRVSLKRSWHQIKQPLRVWFTTIFLISINMGFYLFALRHAPPEHADLINYLWPILALATLHFLPGETLNLSTFISAGLGFFGVLCLLLWDRRVEFFAHEHLLGYVAAFCAAISWVFYLFYSKKRPTLSSDIVGLSFGGTALIFLVFHLQAETFLPLTTFEWSIALLIGTIIQGGAFSLWDYGIKKGSFELLNILSYATPVASIALLIFLGFGVATPGLAIATLFVTLGISFPTLAELCFATTQKRKVPFR